MAAEAPEGAFLVINGRRWRTSDPGIPARLRQELVNELMAARRCVRDATSDEVRGACRRRVNDAKVALGERGHAWWLSPTPHSTRRRIEATARALLRHRQTATICPSDIARSVGGTAWRSLMPVVRECAVVMAHRGELDVLRRGRLVTTKQDEGVLRYRLRAT